MSFARTDGRAADDLRPVCITPGFLPYAEGSVLIQMGNTRVVCAASLEDRVPPFLRNSGQGGPSGRTHEIQRLIGRSLRAIADLKVLGERTITIDCDVLQADGGTRTAAITGAFVAFALASKHLLKSGKIQRSIFTDQVAAISVGIVGNTPLLDLKYDEDSRAEVDMNVVCTGDGRFIELQGTAEREPFSRSQMDELVALASRGIETLIAIQKKIISDTEISI